MKLFRVAAVAISTMAIGAAASADDYPDVTLKYAHFLAENYYQTQADQQFIEAVQSGSEGNIKITPFWQGSLGGAREMFDLVRSGAVDFGAIVTGFFPSDLPLSAVTNTLPMVFFDGEAVVAASRELFKNNEHVVAELEANNLKPLIFRYLPNYRLTCGEPIRTMADLEGKRLLSYGAFVPILMDAIGGVPVSMGLPEVYESLSRGALDCGYMHHGGTEFRKWHEVAPYISDLDFGVINAYVIFMNLDRWNSMTPDAQKLIEEAAAAASDRAIADMQEADDAGLQMMLDAGGERIAFEETDVLRAQVPDMLDIWITEMDKAGRGDAARELVDEVRALIGG